MTHSIRLARIADDDPGTVEHAHIEQVSVLPRVQGQGIGRSLVDTADRWAHQQGLAGLTLTTFRDVPWNAPLYEHLGFREVSEGAIGPELAMRRAEETSHGSDPSTRICMRRPLSP